LGSLNFLLYEHGKGKMSEEAGGGDKEKSGRGADKREETWGRQMNMF
jgi:hypothetical protein